jgi:hypothetical protein
MDDGVESDFSSPVVGSTASDEVLAPSGVTASDGLFNDTVLVLWDSSDNADYYRVFRSESSQGAYSQLGGDLHGTAFYDLVVDPDLPYYYKVKAFNEEGRESDFSTETIGRASTAGIDGPEIIQGDPVVNGTYHSADEMVGTYAFNEDGSCERVIAAPEDDNFNDYYQLEGTWQYEGRGLVIDTFTEIGFGTTMRMTETYPDAFTTDIGETLYLVGAKQVRPDEDEFAKFVGSGLLHIVIEGFVGDEIVSPIEATVIVNEDGSGKATLIVGEEPPVVESWPAGSYESRLIEFDGAYFLEMEEDTLLIRQ